MDVVLPACVYVIGKVQSTYALHTSQRSAPTRVIKRKFDFEIYVVCINIP